MYNNSNARSIFANSDNDIEIYAAWQITVGPSAGTLTLDGGASVTIVYWDGAAYQTTSAAGNLTLGEGTYFLWKETETQYWLDGPNAS